MSSWVNTYKMLYKKMGSNAYIGTLCSTLNYYMNKNKKLFSTSWSIGTKSGKLVAKEIDYGYPPILLMHGHYIYGNHYVLALGYYQFSYSKYDSTYILIADGDSKETQYVFGSSYVTIDSDNYSYKNTNKISLEELWTELSSSSFMAINE